LLYTACLAGILLWFFNSPDPRFAYGWLLFAGCLAPAWFLAPLLSPLKVRLGLLTCAGVTLWYLLQQWEPGHLVTPGPVRQPDYKAVAVGSTTYHIPELLPGNWNTRCYYTPLPCIYEYNPYLQQRTPNLKDGFRMWPRPDSAFVINYRY
ncbi:MAG TPA: hypothetical protein VG870_09300, partial [Chitinophagaceae bacterium]|nr:hypothetical protein [Chitinophagaceae bacterium]